MKAVYIGVFPAVDSAVQFSPSDVEHRMIAKVILLEITFLIA